MKKLYSVKVNTFKVTLYAIAASMSEAEECLLRRLMDIRKLNSINNLYVEQIIEVCHDIIITVHQDIKHDVMLLSTEDSTVGIDYIVSNDFDTAASALMQSRSLRHMPKSFKLITNEHISNIVVLDTARLFIF